MIMRKTSIEITPTPREIEHEIWEMDSTKQTDLILAMGQRYISNTADVLHQLQAISDDCFKLLTDDERHYAILLFEAIADYLK